jgi:hypothetical protein
MAHASVKRIEAVLEPMFTSAISIPTLKPDHREDYAQAWSSNRRPLLTMRSDRQPVATHRIGLGLFEPFSGPSHLPPVATGCDRSAP